MLDAVKQTFGMLSMPAGAICVPADSDPDQILREAKEIIETLGQGDGILILTDTFGGTPSNIAHQLHHDEHVFVVSGLNLSMLLRVFNYPNEPLIELAKKAISGARDGVVCNGDISVC